MSNRLNPIRRLYAASLDEDVSEHEDLSPAEVAELEHLRPLVRALDRLPRQRPAPELLDEVVASAVFASIRSLYGEDPPAHLPPAAADEAAELAPVKEALEQLPPQRPEEEVVDETVAAVTFGAVRSLYDVSRATALPPRAASEAGALAPVKEALDRLPRNRPDPSVIDAVMAAAARPRMQRAAEREAVRPSWRRRIGAAAGTVGAVVLVAIAMLLLTPEQPGEQVAAADQTVEAEPALPAEPRDEPLAALESPTPAPAAGPAARPEPARTTPAPAATVAPEPTAARQAPPAPRADAPVAELTPEAFAALAAVDSELSESALHLLYLRLESLQEGSRVWDEPPVVLGAQIPVRPAASHGWMQVRINR